MIKNKKEKPQKRKFGDSAGEGMSLSKAQKAKSGKLALDGKVNNEKITSSNNASSKKRKMESDKVGKKKFKSALQECPEEGKSLTFKVIFPPGGTCYKEVVRKVINSSESVLSPGWITIKFASEEEAKQKSAELEKLTIADSNLKLKPLFTSPSREPYKRIIYLTQQFKDVEQLKKFYGAASVNQALSGKGNLSHKFILSFESEAKAIAASKKLYNFGKREIELKDIHEKSPTNEKNENQNVSNANIQKKGKKQKSTEQQQKKSGVKEQKRQNENKPKQAKGKNTEDEYEGEDEDEGFSGLEKMKFNLDSKDDDDEEDDDDDDV